MFLKLAELCTAGMKLEKQTFQFDILRRCVCSMVFLQITY